MPPTLAAVLAHSMGKNAAAWIVVALVEQAENEKHKKILLDILKGLKK